MPAHFEEIKISCQFVTIKGWPWDEGADSFVKHGGLGNGGSACVVLTESVKVEPPGSYAVYRGLVYGL